MLFRSSTEQLGDEFVNVPLHVVAGCRLERLFNCQDGKKIGGPFITTPIEIVDAVDNRLIGRQRFVRGALHEVREHRRYEASIQQLRFVNHSTQGLDSRLIGHVIGCRSPDGRHVNRRGTGIRSLATESRTESFNLHATPISNHLKILVTYKVAGVLRDDGERGGG